MYSLLMTVRPMALLISFKDYRRNFLMNFFLKSEPANLVSAQPTFMVLNGL
jgi:hypothetical protein